MASVRAIRRPLGPREAISGSLALSAASLLVPSVPTTDPWGWVVWGRQIVEGQLNTVAGPPSWKPLPVLLTTPLSVLGPAAPDAWLLLARAGGLLALWLAYRLAARAAGPAAGIVAALGLLLSNGWIHDWAHGYSEGMAVAALLGAVELHRVNRRLLALTMLVAVSLSRPEALPFAAAYAAVFARRAVSLALLTAVPALWVLPDWWGSGEFLHAGTVAHGNLTAAGPHPGWALIASAGGMLPVPVWLAAAVGLGFAIHRRDRLMLVLGATCLAWIVLEALATARGYPGAARFLVPPCALACVVAGYGAASALHGLPRRRIAIVATAGALLALPALIALPQDGRDAVVRARFQLDLRQAVERAGGRRLLARGRPTIPGRLWWNAGALAWQLRVPLVDVRKIQDRDVARLRGLRVPAVLFAPLGGTPPDDPNWIEGTRSVGRCGLLVRPVARAGIWRVLVITRARCVGGRRTAPPAPAVRS